ncbi:hypothetical protein AB5J62_23350 [Amycolatopsis sp. cg5]|uniref:hypothetical protein n=1 Tax=Amycolatopsis sp. cg5 TaxID=3238802 RepID=UPI0035266586
MKARIAAAGALLAVGTAGLVMAPSASAGYNAIMLPGGTQTVKPGSNLVVNTKCQLSDLKLGKLTSPVIATVQGPSETSYGEGPHYWSYEVAIKKDAKPGSYPITLDCYGKKMSGTLKVPGTVTKKPASPQVAVKPKGAPQTGGGATAA